MANLDLPRKGPLLELTHRARLASCIFFVAALLLYFCVHRTASTVLFPGTVWAKVPPGASDSNFATRVQSMGRMPLAVQLGPDLQTLGGVDLVWSTTNQSVEWSISMYLHGGTTALLNLIGVDGEPDARYHETGTRREVAGTQWLEFELVSRE